MTNNEILQADMLDILFEHRNKSYGAYALRRHYNQRLVIAISISLATVSLFFLVSLLSGDKNKLNGPLADNGDVIIKTIVIDPPQKIEPPPALKRQAQVATSKVTPILIVPDKLADPIPEQAMIEKTAISTVTQNGVPPTDLTKGVSPTVIKGAGLDSAKEETVDVSQYPPAFPGGPAALALFFSKNLSSPSDLEPGERKVVMVRFVVGADGAVSGTIVLQSGGDAYDREVLRAFKKMPKWNPAIQNGNKIAVSFTQPVTFVGLEE